MEPSSHIHVQFNHHAIGIAARGRSRYISGQSPQLRPVSRDFLDVRRCAGRDWDLGPRKFGLRAWRRQRMLSYLNRTEISLAI